MTNDSRAVPPKVAAAWARAHAALQAQMEFFYERASAGKVCGELSFEGGVPLLAEFTQTTREQIGSREVVLQARRRRPA